MSSPKIFGGIPEKFAKYDKAKIVLLPVPLMVQALGKKGQIKDLMPLLKLQKTWNCMILKQKVKFIKMEFLF